jgi:hypothetical protein
MEGRELSTAQLPLNWAWRWFIKKPEAYETVVECRKIRMK